MVADGAFGYLLVTLWLLFTFIIYNAFMFFLWPFHGFINRNQDNVGFESWSKWKYEFNL